MFKELSPIGISLANLETLLRTSLPNPSSGEQRFDVSVHCARIHSKKLAAALHLYKGLINKSDYRAERKRIKTASRLLSPRRDLDGIRNIIWKNIRQLGTKDRRVIKGWLNDRYLGQSAASPGQLQHALSQMERALRDWPRVQESDATDLFARGVAKCFRSAKKAFRRVRKTKEPGDFHKWRKKAKRLFLQLELVSSLEFVGVFEIDALKKLLGNLGDLQDIEVTRKFIRSEKKGPRKQLKKLAKLLSRDRKTLADKAMKRGAKLFQAKFPRFEADSKASPAGNSATTIAT